MLELSELENRNSLHQLKEIDPGALIRTVIESKQPILLKKNIAVNINIDGELHAMGDQFLLHQAISNLVQNAIDFSPSGSEITVSAKKDDNMIAITVIDNGSGIPDYALEKIFNKFFSLNRPDTEKKSTGLGLNFVREVAELHNGKITIENRPEGGVKAEFRFKIQDSRFKIQDLKSLNWAINIPVIEKFEDMELWQKARAIAKAIYQLTEKEYFSRDYGLKDQVRRASVSIMANIAEGFERGSNKEFIQFLYIAKGSAGEVRAQLYIAFDLGYISKGEFDNLNTELLTLSKQLSGFIKYLISSKLKGHKR
jgi:four helix bundle protein